MKQQVKILKHDEAREKLLEGLNDVADIVKVTLGAKGRNVAIKMQFGPNRITKDGVSIARTIQFKDEAKDMGANLIRYAAMYTAEGAGDGTTTCTVLTQAIVNEANKYLIAGVNPLFLKNGINYAKTEVEKFLNHRVCKIENNDRLKSIAKVSCNGDEEMASKIVEAFDKMGKDGAIIVEESKKSNSKFELNIIDGMQFNVGFSSYYFINNTKKSTCEFNDPLILCVNEEINDIGDAKVFFEKVGKSGRPLVLFCKGVAEVLEDVLIKSKLQNNFQVCIVKINEDSHTDDIKNLYHDISVKCNSLLIDSTHSIYLRNVKDEDFGTAKKIIISKEKTRIIDGCHDEEKLQERIDYYNNEIENAQFSNMKEKYQICLARLKSGVAVLKPGGNTEVEMLERRDRLEDAIYACQGAMEEGYLPGGGISLFNASLALNKLEKNSNEDFNLGVKIFINALTIPLKTICDNGGINGDEVIATLKHIYNQQNDESENFKTGYNIETDQYVNLVDEGIIDPFKVTKRALNDATSIATMLITTSGIIFPDLDMDEKPQYDFSKYQK